MAFLGISPATCANARQLTCATWCNHFNRGFLVLLFLSFFPFFSRSFFDSPSPSSLLFFCHFVLLPSLVFFVLDLFSFLLFSFARRLDLKFTRSFFTYCKPIWLPLAVVDESCIEDIFYQNCRLIEDVSIYSTTGILLYALRSLLLCDDSSSYSTGLPIFPSLTISIRASRV